MRYTWLFFDADGTLFDYEQGEAHALENAFQELNIPLSPAATSLYREINRQVWLDFENARISAERLRTVRFERLFDALGMQVDADSFSERYLSHLSRATELVDGAEEIIRALRGTYRLGLITNGLKDVQRPRLNGSALRGMFDVLAISEEIGTAKPDPRFFDAAFAMAGEPPRDTVLVIGDSLSSDILGGTQYGLDTCWFNPQRQPPDPRIPATYEIHTLAELFGILG